MSRYSIIKVILWDHEEKKEVEVEHFDVETEGETVGYKGYKEPAKAWLLYGNERIELK